MDDEHRRDQNNETHDGPGSGDTHLDGNALGGPLSAIFAGDLTTATAVCAGCGRAEQVAVLRVYGAHMGLVARCPGCDQVMIGYTDLPTGRTLQLQGTAAIRMPVA